MAENSYKPVSIVLQGTNDTFKGYINMTVKESTTPVDYDEVGAAYYVIAVVLVYGLSMVLLIGSLAKKNMKDSSLEHDDRQVSRYLENVPSLKEMSAREQYKELKSNIITLVTSKTPPGDLFRSHSTSSLEREELLASSNTSDAKKVSFSIGDETLNGKMKKAGGAPSGKDFLGISGDTSASENSPLLGYGSPHTSSCLGYRVARTRDDSDGYTQDSDSELDSPILKPKFKCRSSWGETRVYNKGYYSAARNNYPSHLVYGEHEQPRKPQVRVTEKYTASESKRAQFNQGPVSVSEKVLDNTDERHVMLYEGDTTRSQGEHVIAYNEAYPVRYNPEMETQHRSHTAAHIMPNTRGNKRDGNVLQPISSTITYSPKIRHAAVKLRSDRDCSFEIINETPQKPSASHGSEDHSSGVYIPKENRLQVNTNGQNYTISPRGSPLINIKESQAAATSHLGTFQVSSNTGAFTPFKRDTTSPGCADSSLHHLKGTQKNSVPEGYYQTQGPTSISRKVDAPTWDPYQTAVSANLQDGQRKPQMEHGFVRYPNQVERTSSNFKPRNSETVAVDVHRTVGQETNRYKEKKGDNFSSKGKKVYCKICRSSHLPPKCSIIFDERDPVCHSSDGDSSCFEDDTFHITTV